MDNKSIFLEAVEKNTVIDFLEGKMTSSLINNSLLNIAAPVDWTQLIPNTVYDLYNQHPDMHIDVIFNNALIEMCKGSMFDIYCAISIIYFHCIRKERKAAPFDLEKSKIIPVLKEKLSVILEIEDDTIEKKEIQRIRKNLLDRFHFDL